MTYEEFLQVVERESGASREQAEHGIRATLQTLGERISGGQARDIGAQLPAPIDQLLADGANAEPFGVEEFVRRVAEREQVLLATAERHARAVFAALGRALSADELADMASELPKDFERLLAAARGASAAGVPEADDGEPMPAEEFVRRAAARAGLDREDAERMTDAVLEALADRITGGEVDDLEQRLATPLHAPLERGRAQSNGAARPLSLEEFERGIAERAGVPAAEVRDDARAVFATLREAVGEDELSDVAAQLGNDYAALLARP